MDIKGFIDDDVILSKQEYSPLPLLILENVSSYKLCLADIFICVIGIPVARRGLIEFILERGREFISLIHHALIGEGSCSMCYVDICPNRIESSYW